MSRNKLWVRNSVLKLPTNSAVKLNTSSLPGMFFSHVGWLLVKKHPDVMKYGNKLNFDDVLSDPIVQFQRK